MTIQVISDIHQEFGFNELCFDQADVVIIPGDLNIGIRGVDWLLDNITTKPVIYILGNHEYYKGSYPRTLEKIKEKAMGSNVIVLENESISIEGITFHGTTLWTDFSLYGNPRYFGIICQSKMTDYKRIRRDPSYSKLRTLDTYHIHKQSLEWLKESLENSGTKKNIVITHHAPSIKSLPDEFVEDPISSAYASNLEAIIQKYQPDYWLHGHIHTPAHYSIGDTQIICNPHGYIDEKYNGYNKELLIEV